MSCNEQWFFRFLLDTESESDVRAWGILMSEGCGLSESGSRRARGTLTVFLNCIFFCMGLGTQGAVLGAEDPFSSLILSTDLGVTEEPGGSQGAVLPSESAKASATASPDSPVGSAGVSLKKSSLPAASAFVRSPENIVDNVNQPVGKSGAISGSALIEVRKMS